MIKPKNTALLGLLAVYLVALLTACNGDSEKPAAVTSIIPDPTRPSAEAIVPTLVPLVATSVSTDREALVALYHATNGPEWPVSRGTLNWATDKPLGEWFGVTTNADGRVIALNLCKFELEGSIPPVVGHLAELEELCLWGGGLTGPIPPELGRMTKLKELRLAKNRLTGPIPPELGNLSNLTILDLSGIRASFSKLVESDDLVSRRRVEPEAGEAGLSGIIPPELGNLSELRELDLRSNYLNGHIPPELGRLSNLTFLELSENSLTGTVPPELASLTNLELLNLYFNFLSGPIPESFEELAGLNKFFFGYNQGLCLPETILTWQSAIERSSRVICEEVPPDSPIPIADREALESLYHSTGGPKWYRSTNWLTELPLGSWYGVTANKSGHVTALDLTGNRLVGTLPPELATLSELSSLNVDGNQLGGELPAWLIQVSGLQHLSFAYNDGLCLPLALETWSAQIETVGGPVCQPQTPGLVGDREALTALYHAANGPEWKYNRNWLSGLPLGEWAGVRTDEKGRVVSLDFHADRSPGSNAPGDPRKKEFPYRGNKMQGKLPAEMGNLTELGILDLDENLLTGEIPAEFANLSKLTYLDLGGNNLSGSIPTGLGRLHSLQELDLGGNYLSGSIPTELAGLPYLTHLNLSDNKLTGPIPPELGGLKNLSDLQLNGNQLSGPIPPEFGGLENAEQILLYSNNLSGPIPPELGRLAHVYLLYINDNRLTGELPANFIAHSGLSQFSFSGNDGLCAPTWMLSWLAELLKYWGPICPYVSSPPTPSTAVLRDRDALIALYRSTGGPNWHNAENWLTDKPLGYWFDVSTNTDGRVVAIDLVSNGLVGPLPTELANLQALESWYLMIGKFQVQFLVNWVS